MPKKTHAEIIAAALIAEAIAGNVQAIHEVGDRTEGKPAQAIALDLEVQDWRHPVHSSGLEINEVLTRSKITHRVRRTDSD